MNCKKLDILDVHNRLAERWQLLGHKVMKLKVLTLKLIQLKLDQNWLEQILDFELLQVFKKKIKLKNIYSIFNSDFFQDLWIKKLKLMLKT